ncbi:MAG: ZIP family metal transporter [Schleiferiaceae bacterium]|nr:ZIP family metal transporter [Schleiferiaceae bacterium]
MTLKIILLIASVVIGVAIVELFRPQSNQPNLKLLTAFSGAFLLSISFLHLLPEVFTGGHHHHHEGEALLQHDHSIGLMILLGFIFQILLEWLSSGIEHGHMHGKQFKKGIVPYSALLGLFLHAFFEGIPLFVQADDVSSRSLLLGIVVHKIPVSIVLYIMMLQLNIGKKIALIIMLIFALLAPLAAILGNSLHVALHYSNHITAFVIGIFFHISTTILFEAEQDHRFNLKKLLTIITAGIIAWFSVLH